MSATSILLGVLGSIITLSIFTAGVIYKMGHHAARLESLEAWRTNVRSDMHEISNILQGISQQIIELKTLVEERTERRNLERVK